MAVKKLAGVIQKGVFAIPITAGFKCDAVDFGNIGIGGPEDAFFAVGGVDEVAFVSAPAGFGAAGVLQGGVDDDDGAGSSICRWCAIRAGLRIEIGDRHRWP